MTKLCKTCGKEHTRGGRSRFCPDCCREKVLATKRRHNHKRAAEAAAFVRAPDLTPCVRCGEMKEPSRTKPRKYCRRCSEATQKITRNERKRRYRQFAPVAEITEAEREARNARQRAGYTKGRTSALFRARKLLHAAAARAACRNESVTLDAAFVAAKIEQGCPILGMPFDLEGNGLSPLAPSLDRIDSKKGYTPENTRVVAAFVNYAKNRWSDTEFRWLIARAGDRIMRGEA